LSILILVYGFGFSVNTSLLGLEAKHNASEDTAFYWIHDAPLLSYLGAKPAAKRFEVSLFIVYLLVIYWLLFIVYLLFIDYCLFMVHYLFVCLFVVFYLILFYCLFVSLIHFVFRLPSTLQRNAKQIWTK
jgi:hypothetical protein